MYVFGWIIVSLGTVSLTTSVVLELIKKEPIYLLFAKISAGVMGIGGILLAISLL